MNRNVVSDEVDAAIGLFGFLVALFAVSYLVFHLWLALNK